MLIVGMGSDVELSYFRVNEQSSSIGLSTNAGRETL